MPSSSPRRRRPTCRSPWPRSSAGSRSSSRSRSRRRPTRRTRIVAAAAVAGVPVQVGHVERFNPAVLELGRLLDAGWLSTVYAITSRRAGPFPARIRDVGRDRSTSRPTTSTSCRSSPASARSRVSAETAQRVHEDRRGPPVRAAVVPVGRRRHARRRLADPGQAPDADRRRRGGHVRARLPDSQRLTFTRSTDTTNPRLIARLRADVRGRSRSTCPLAVGRAARRRARRVPRGRPRRRSAGRRRRGRALGRGRSPTSLLRAAARAADRRARRGRRAMTITSRPSTTARASPAARSRSRRTPAGHAPARPASRRGAASRARPGPSPSSGPGRWACRWPPSSRRTAGRSSRSMSTRASWRRSTTAARTSTRSPAWPSSSRAAHGGGPAARHDRRRRRGARGRRRRAHRAGHAR